MFKWNNVGSFKNYVFIIRKVQSMKRRPRNKWTWRHATKKDTFNAKALSRKMTWSYVSQYACVCDEQRKAVVPLGHLNVRNAKSFKRRIVFLELIVPSSCNSKVAFNVTPSFAVRTCQSNISQPGGAVHSYAARIFHVHRQYFGMCTTRLLEWTTALRRKWC